MTSKTALPNPVLPNPVLPSNAQAIDPPSLERHFDGAAGLLPLWIAEPYVDLAAPISDALRSRASTSWYGYETRNKRLLDGFWQWMQDRHNWKAGNLKTIVSPSVGTSIGVLLEQLTSAGDGVIIQPPVFTDFKPLIVAAEREVVRNGLTLGANGYHIDFDDLEAKAANPANTALILCNPHNPVGRVWTHAELERVAEICGQHAVFVIADEIHADLALKPHSFTPFAAVAASSNVRWAALHGPIKTFGLAGVCDTLVISEDEQAIERFGARSSQLHLTRNNVFGLVAFEAAYSQGADWFDEFLTLIAHNAALLKNNLPEPISLVPLEGTYLAWLDFRELGFDVPELAMWLAESARLGLSPGHWFGREGAGFARLTIAAPTSHIEDAITRLEQAIKATS